MNLVGSWNDNGGINYTAPAMDMAGAAITIKAGYVPKAEDAYVTGGGTSGASATFGSGTDLGVIIAHDSGMTVGLYGATREREAASAVNDAFEGTVFAKYAMGPVSIGYQMSYVDPGLSPGQTAANVAKAVGTTGAGKFDSELWSIAFNVNDDFSVSYGEYQSRKAGYTQDAVQSSEETRVVEVTSWQAAYTMGGASFRVADVKADNVGFSASDDQTATIVSLGLAF